MSGCLAGLLAGVGGTAAQAAPAPKIPAPPDVTGTAVVGERLEATGARWTPADDRSTATWTWLRCLEGDCTAIAGAAGTAYTVAPADVGWRLRVRLTVSVTGREDAVATSSPTDVVPRPVPSAGEGPGTPPTVPGGATPGGGATPTPTPTPEQEEGTAVTEVTGPESGSFTSNAGPAAAATPPPAPAGAQSSGPAFIRPFPVFRIAGRFTGRNTRVTLATVRAPVGARIAVACRFRDCPFAFRRRRAAASLVRLRALRRTYRPGAVVVVRVTLPGLIGKYARLRIRSGKPPARRDGCLMPGSRLPVRCPSP